MTLRRRRRSATSTVFAVDGSGWQRRRDERIRPAGSWSQCPAWLPTAPLPLLCRRSRQTIRPPCDHGARLLCEAKDRHANKVSANKRSGGPHCPHGPVGRPGWKARLESHRNSNQSPPPAPFDAPELHALGCGDEAHGAKEIAVRGVIMANTGEVEAVDAAIAANQRPTQTAGGAVVVILVNWHGKRGCGGR